MHIWKRADTTPYVLQQNNICNMFIVSYILTIWRTRKENLRIVIIKKMIVNKCLYVIDTIKHMPNHTVERFLGNAVPKLDPMVILSKQASKFLISNVKK